MTKWSARFDGQGDVTLSPDTPETRREFAETWRHLQSGEAEIDAVEIRGERMPAVGRIRVVSTS